MTTLQIEVVGGGGGGDFSQGGGGGSGAYQKVVLSVTPGARYQYVVGGGPSGKTNTIVYDQNGNVVACGAGGLMGEGQAPGSGGSLALSCTLDPPPAANIVNIDGRAGQFGQMYQFPVPPGNLEIIIVPGAGGPPVMLGAGAGGPGGPNSNGV